MLSSLRLMWYEEEHTCMSYEEEEDTCMSYEKDTCMSYEKEERFCHRCVSCGAHEGLMRLPLWLPRRCMYPPPHITCMYPPPCYLGYLGAA
jgi:ribosomal protein S14